jgi:hypothetical protein
MARIGPDTLSDEALKEKLAAFDNVPLFMKALPDAVDAEQDPTYTALQSLVHGGTPDGG